MRSSNTDSRSLNWYELMLGTELRESTRAPKPRIELPGEPVLYAQGKCSATFEIEFRTPSAARSFPTPFNYDANDIKGKKWTIPLGKSDAALGGADLADSFVYDWREEIGDKDRDGLTLYPSGLKIRTSHNGRKTFVAIQGMELKDTSDYLAGSLKRTRQYSGILYTATPPTGGSSTAPRVTRARSRNANPGPAKPRRTSRASSDTKDTQLTNAPSPLSQQGPLDDHPTSADPSNDTQTPVLTVDPAPPTLEPPEYLDEFGDRGDFNEMLSPWVPPSLGPTYPRSPSMYSDASGTLIDVPSYFLDGMASSPGPGGPNNSTSPLMSDPDISALMSFNLASPAPQQKAELVTDASYHHISNSQASVPEPTSSEEAEQYGDKRFSEWCSAFDQ
ncbi:uncharacterized protein MKK02DRAFT_38307 [Dioszegia hungarica]|uniref:Uncharacterized protein n=1 Tax=Dioszegia hungarica TaxID=4972 RepID=A0AA38H6T2_9TREE|nr:uncharacterized protein MKK02DRAFT_38307 [Dioszegia hungarica]KAI9633649.1 hypothetical protein MKK02DRAFT_38307 [Dioszegia hungarica]